MTQPMVVCTTADQLGSRLLFRGYGVSDSMQPIHAALTACDSLVLLDEAHVTRAFSQTMQLLSRYQQLHSTAPPLRFVQLTATPAGEVPPEKRFNLQNEDWSDPRNAILKDRRSAIKPAKLIRLEKKQSLVTELTRLALDSRSDTRKAIGIIVNRVQTARDVAQAIKDKLKKDAGEAEVYLMIGRMRPLDRDDVQGELRNRVGPDRPDLLDKSVFVVATQCLEVGADYDFDALLTECASIDSIRQRFGRLNRRGRKLPNGTPFEVNAAIVATDESLKGDDPIYGSSIQKTWNWLSEGSRTEVNFGIGAFQAIWEKVVDPQPLLAPAVDAAVLLPAHLDALCQTSPRPHPSPDVSYFIHGPQRDNAEVSVCWRADLGNDYTLWPDIVRLLPPTSRECMTVPLIAVRKWMAADTNADGRDADVPVAQIQEDQEKRRTPEEGKRVLAWRGSKDAKAINDPKELRPGDTVVIRTRDAGWHFFGEIPSAPTAQELEWLERKGPEDDEMRKEIERRCDLLDCAQESTRDARLRVVVRLHPAFPEFSVLRGLDADELREQLVDLQQIEDGWRKKKSRFDRHQYPGQDPESPNPKDEVIVFARLLEPKDRLQLPPVDDDEDDSLSEADKPVSLEQHTRHVVERIGPAVKVLFADSDWSSIFRIAADLHDLGKADTRFQALLAGITPYEAMERPLLLAKSGCRRLTRAERAVMFQRAQYPNGFRHEMLSTQIVEHRPKFTVDNNVDRDLLLHLIAAHHGNARPFAPITMDEPDSQELLSVNVADDTIDAEERRQWIASHRLDSGIAERFWNLTQQHGWWGLAYLESVLRLCDQQASAAEQAEPGGAKQ